MVTAGLQVAAQLDTEAATAASGSAGSTTTTTTFLASAASTTTTTGAAGAGAVSTTGSGASGNSGSGGAGSQPAVQAWRVTGAPDLVPMIDGIGGALLLVGRERWSDAGLGLADSAQLRRGR